MIKLINSNRFELKGTDGRYIHLATMQDSLKEYVCFFDLQEKKLYIEQVLGTQFMYIENDEVVKELEDFLFGKHITDLKYGTFVADKT